MQNAGDAMHTAERAVLHSLFDSRILQNRNLHKRKKKRSGGPFPIDTRAYPPGKARR